MSKIFPNSQLDDKTESLLIECVFAPLHPKPSMLITSTEARATSRAKRNVPDHLRKAYPEAVIKNRKVFL